MKLKSSFSRLRFDFRGSLNEVVNLCLHFRLEIGHFLLCIFLVLLFGFLFVLDSLLLFCKLLGMVLLEDFLVFVLCKVKRLVDFILGRLILVFYRCIRLSHCVSKAVNNIFIHLCYTRLTHLILQIILFLQQRTEGHLKLIPNFSICLFFLYLKFTFAKIRQLHDFLVLKEMIIVRHFLLLEMDCARYSQQCSNRC